MADNIGSKISFFLVGLGIGAVVGILFAPKSGEETREFLSKKAEEGRDYAQRKAEETREFLSKKADEGREYAQRTAKDLRERAEGLVEQSKQAVTHQKDSIAAAVDAGREAYQREKAKGQ